MLFYFFFINAVLVKWNGTTLDLKNPVLIYHTEIASLSPDNQLEFIRTGKFIRNGLLICSSGSHAVNWYLPSGTSVQRGGGLTTEMFVQVVSSVSNKSLLTHSQDDADHYNGLWCCGLKGMPSHQITVGIYRKGERSKYTCGYV